MKRKRRTEITVETDEQLVIRSTRRSPVVWCPTCSEAGAMLPVDDAVVLTSLSANEIYHLVELGRVHHTETAEGFLLVCLKSLGEGLEPGNWSECIER